MHFKYSGHGPMPVVMFFSGGASSIEALHKNPGHGRDYRIIGAVTNRKEERVPKGYKVARDAGVEPVFVNPFEFGEGEDAQRAFYGEVLRKVNEMGPAVVGLSGWLKKFSIIKPPLIDGQYPILNVHPANLGVMIPGEDYSALELGRAWIHTNRLDISRDFAQYKQPGLKRAFDGKDAVTTAVLCGEKNVCSTIHQVTGELDKGPNVAQSKRVEVDWSVVNPLLRQNAAGDVVAYASQLQDRMKVECDGPAFCRVMELLGRKQMELLDDGVRVDGVRQPYGGYQM